MPIATINPFNGEVIQTFEPLSDAQIEQKLELQKILAEAAGHREQIHQRDLADADPRIGRQQTGRS